MNLKELFYILYILLYIIFSIYLKDLFFQVDFTEVCSFSDDSTYFARNKGLGSLINRLENHSFLAIE